MSVDLRLMAVHAHPDDESSKGAASTRKYVDEGIEVTVVTCTGGEAGSFLNEQYVIPQGVDISTLRRDEMARAQEILGVNHVWLGYIDSGMDEPLPPHSFSQLPLDEVSRPLAEQIRRVRPQVVTTYDENGGYPHPDHIRTHQATMRAIELAADSSVEIAGEPWSVQKVYYHHTFSRSKTVALHEAMVSRGLSSGFEEWLADWSEENDNFKRVTTRVSCHEYFPVRDAALRAHATQVDPDGDWFRVPAEVEVEIWPTEDFELAYSTIGSELPETDLFAGLR